MPPIAVEILRPGLKAGLVVALVAATLVRAIPFTDVFTGSGIRLAGDDDAAYHVLRAERILRGTPGAPWFDPALGYPAGAEIPWPPLFDYEIAGVARVLHPVGEVPRDTVAAIGSVLPLVLGLLTLPLLAALALSLAGGATVEAMLLLALLPAHAVFTQLGRADQHAQELLVACLALLPLARGLRDPESPPLRGRLLLGVALAGAFWTWMGSAVLLALMAAFGAGLFLVGPAGSPATRRYLGDLAAGGVIGGLILGATLLGFRGPPALGRMGLAGLTGYHVLLVLLVSAFAAALAWCETMPARFAAPGRRLAALLAASGVPLGLASTYPAFREASWRGLAALGRSNAWYQNVLEFDPLIFAGYVPWTQEARGLLALYGLTLVAAPFSLALLLRRIGSRAGPAAPLAFLVAWTGGFLALGLARQRFALYLSAPLSISVGEGWRAAAHALAARAGGGRRALLAAYGVLGALLVGPALALAPATLAGEDPEHALLRNLLEQSRDLPTADRRPAVLSEWAFGHLVQYAAGRPVLVSPFGTEGGDRVMEDAAVAYLSLDPDEVESVLARREIGQVLLADPVTEAHFAHGFAPDAWQEIVHLERSVLRGARVRVSPSLRATVPGRLFFADGGENGPMRALGTFRLLDEASAAPGAPPRFKLFGWVPGARVVISAARPGGLVRGLVAVSTTTGRRIAWATSATADAAGQARIRVPWTTGQNGRSRAGELELFDGGGLARVRLTEGDVLQGRVVPVALGQP